MATKRICSIEGCGKPQIARGWCGTHYQRWKKHGNPLVVQTTVGKRRAQRYYREVVLSYSGDECLTWPFTTIKGYGAILLDNRKQIVSRLVCEEEHGPAPTATHEAAHSCGRGQFGCVAKAHISWKTPIENAADKIMHGTVSRGPSHGKSKLSEADVRKIRSLKGTASMNAIGRQFGVSAASIWQIFNGKAWAWVE